VGGSGPAEPARVVDVAEHADDERGSGPPRGQHPAFGGGDHGHLAHVADPQPQDGGEDEVGPGEAPVHVVGAQYQVGALPPVQVLQQQAERGLGQGGHHADLDAGRGELGQRLVDAGERQDPEPVHRRLERPLEGVAGGLGPDLVLGEQGPHDVGGRPPARPVELHHRPDVRRGAGDHALGGDRLGERPLQDAAIDGGRPHHVTADQRYASRIAHLLAS
jgi:hypothetical protein